MENKEKSFEFEKWVCFDKLWLWENEAQNLFYSAEVLNHVEDIKLPHVFEKNKKFTELFPENITERGFFNHRIQRMLWGYGFECLFKMLILKKIKENGKHDRITSEVMSQIKSHDLIILSERAGIILSEPEVFYLRILTKCAEWAGRYPLPIRSGQMYEQREGLSSSEALHERHRKKWDNT